MLKCGTSVESKLPNINSVGCCCICDSCFGQLSSKVKNFLSSNMKRKVFVSFLLNFFLLVIVPTSSAIQLQQNTKKVRLKFWYDCPGFDPRTFTNMSWQLSMLPSLLMVSKNWLPNSIQPFLYQENMYFPLFMLAHCLLSTMAVFRMLQNCRMCLSFCKTACEPHLK